MTQQPALPTDYSRFSLWALLNRRIRASAELTRQSHSFYGQRLTLLRHIEVAHEAADGMGDDGYLCHCWSRLPPYVLRAVVVGERFSFTALVMPYQRSNGVESVTLTSVMLERGGHGTQS